MATFEQYQAKLKELGTEAVNIRKEADRSAATSPALGAEYNRIMDEIDGTVAAIYAEHPGKCWNDGDSRYQALKAQWALDWAEAKRRAQAEEQRLLAAMEAIIERSAE